MHASSIPAPCIRADTRGADKANDMHSKSRPTRAVPSDGSESAIPEARAILVLAANIDVLEHCPLGPLLELIPNEQAQAIRRNRQLRDRQRRILARLLIALGLSLLDNWDMRAGLSAWRQEPQGRPWIAGSSRPVSISHAGQWAACAIGPLQTVAGVGIDVEEIRPLNAEDFCLVFTDQERTAIRQADNPTSELIRRWTIKEAMLKAAGTGLLADPLLTNTSGNGEADGRDWRHLPLSPGYWLTVAGLAPGASVQLVLPARDQILGGLEAASGPLPAVAPAG